jgi:class 3 adenylate cyclase
VPEERKLVTILFADVTGSTAMGEDLDPEDVRALMGRYYDHARQVVSDHGGTLEKFIGDAVMAVFGLPQAHGDDAERAVVAALALRELVAGDPVLQGVQLRIAVNTGEVVATSDSDRGDFLVTGDAVNVAARLQQAALPGELLAGHRTHEAARMAFHFGDGREVEVKGKREPLRVYPVAGVREVRQTIRPPMVGREEDLMMLSLLHHRALRESRPQLASIVAPAGTGKTRLLEEFLADVDQTAARVAIGRCLPYGQTLTYWPLRGLLDSLLGAGYTRSTVQAALQDGGHAPEDAARLADLVLTTVGIGSEERAESPGERETIFNAWQLLLEALARAVPRIIVFEDLHWASDSLLDLAEHVMSPRTRAPILVIATSRPELLDRRPGWGGGRQSFTALGLSALEADETRTVVDALGPDLTEPVRQRIVERSGGNPFFAVELVRIAAEHAIGDTQSVLDALPDTVHAAVLARIDLLSPDERAGLQAASVVGRAFRPATLQAVLDREEADVKGALDGLLTRDLIVSADQPGSYTFRHILIRDVAYGTLSRTERIRMHAAVAKWLEGFAAGRLDEFTELIAYHYREAVLLAQRAATPLPLPIEPARAQRFLERAGTLAGRAGAFVEARFHLLGAISIAPVADQPRLYENLGDSAPFGDWSVEAHGKALESWRRDPEGDPLVGARLMRKLLITYMRWQGSVTVRPSEPEIIAMRQDALRLAEQANDEDEIWRVRVADLFWPFWRGRITDEEVESGKTMGPAAAAHFERKEDWIQVHEALDGYASILLLAGDYRGVVEASSRRLSLPGGTALEYGDAGNVTTEGLAWLGEYPEAMAMMRGRRAALRPGEPVAMLGNGAAMAALSACLSGRWDDLPFFGDMLWQAWDELQREAAPGFLLAGFFSLYHVALAREDRAASDAAGAALERLVSPAPRGGGRGIFHAYKTDDPPSIDFTAYWRSNRSMPFALMLANDRGVRLSAAMLESVRQLGGHGTDALDRCLDIAQALAADSPEKLAAAIDEAERHQLVPHAARMRIVFAQMTGNPDPLTQARPVLERLQDRQFLHRLEEVAAGT